MSDASDTPKSAPLQGRPARKPGAPGAPRAKSSRRRAREFALQGLYEWQLNTRDGGSVDAHIREQEDFARCDRAHYDALQRRGLGGVARVAHSSSSSRLAISTATRAASRLFSSTRASAWAWFSTVRMALATGT